MLIQLVFLCSFITAVNSAGCGPAQPCSTGTATCSTCGQRKSSSRKRAVVKPSIVDGQEATPNSWGWQAHLTDDSGLCGGTLIAAQYVLTAAHCFDNGATVTVRLGEHDTDVNSGNEIEIQGTVTNHADYVRATLVNDIAIIKLASAVTFNVNIQPACLPTKSCTLTEGTEVYITGWGGIEKGEQDSAVATKLQEAKVKYANSDDCAAEVNPNAFCLKAITNQAQICPGDSGGPANVKVDNCWTVQGVSSYITGNCESGESYMTSVAAYRDWIDTQMAA